MDRFSEPQTASETTGTLSRDSGASSATGPRPGESGYGRMSNECADPEPLEPGTARWDSFMEEMRARDAKREAEVRKLKDSAPWHEVPIEHFMKGHWMRPRELNAPHTIEDTRSDYLRMGRHESVPPSLSEAQAAEVRRRLAIARERAAPAPREQIAAMILKLAATVRIPELAAIETMTEIMIEELSDVSPEVLEHTFRHWIRTQKSFRRSLSCSRLPSRRWQCSAESNANWRCSRVLRQILHPICGLRAIGLTHGLRTLAPPPIRLRSWTS